jgi:hypothetical protein
MRIRRGCSSICLRRLMAKVRFSPAPRLFDLIFAYAAVYNRRTLREQESRLKCPPLPIGID